MDHHDHMHGDAESEAYLGGLLSYYWPNATYVHCASTKKSSAGQCRPLRISSEAYDGRLPEEHWKEYVDGDGFVNIPCGEAVQCASTTLQGPFGPLAVDGSEHVAALKLGGEYYVEWHPLMYTECRSPGVYAHALLMVLACVVMLPLGYAALCRNRGAGQDQTRSSTQVDWMKKAFGWLRLGGFVLAASSAIIVSIQQSVMGSKLECAGTGTGSRTQHGTMGWICLAMLAGEMLHHTILSSKGRHARGLVAVMRVAKRFCELLSKAFSILQWVLKGILGYTLSSKTTKYTVLLGLTLGCILSGIWQSCGCYEYGHLVAQEFGHMTYAILWISLAAMSMTYNHPKLRRELTLNEGVDLLMGGMLSVIIVTIGTQGRLLVSPSSGTVAEELATAEQFMKDIQHTTQAGIWAVSGFLGVCLARLGIASGLPFLMAALCHGSMVLLHGHQANEISLLGHNLHAYSMILTGVLRFFWRTHEAAFFLTLTALLFVASSNCACSWAFARNFDPISYFLSIVIICTLLWGWFIYVSTDKTKAVRAGENTGENSFYMAQELQNKCTSQMASSSMMNGRESSVPFGCYSKVKHEHSIEMHLK